MSEMFANALGYEELMGRWSVRLAPLYTEFSRLRDGGRILDVGCGTGALIKTIADKARTSEIVGIDPAQSFIDYASTRFNDPRIVLKVGDAMQLPFPAAHFEQTLSLLVMMFVPQPERAANEMKRVTRPGGTVSACTWHRDELELSSIFLGRGLQTRSWCRSARSAAKAFESRGPTDCTVAVRWARRCR